MKIYKNQIKFRIFDLLFELIMFSNETTGLKKWVYVFYDILNLLLNTRYYSIEHELLIYIL